LILETPCERPDPADPTGKKVIDDKSVWATEIKLLESLIGMDPESELFKKLEKELSDKGEQERQEMQAQYERKLEKERKKMSNDKDKEREKGQKSLKDMFGKQNGKVKGVGKQTTAKKKTEDREEEESDLSDLSDFSDMSVGSRI
jgi:AP endonuclease-1